MDGVPRSAAPVLITVVVAIGALVVFLGGLAAMVTTCLKTAAPDEALVVTAPAGRKVSTTSILVIPVVQTLDRVSLREHAVVLERRGDAALRTGDEQAVEMVATFQLRVGRTEDDILRALAAMGPRTGSPDAVRERFTPALTHALEAVTRELDAQAIDRDREELKDRVLERVGQDLDGFHLADLAITGVRVLRASPDRG